MQIGKEKGYVLYDEVSEVLPGDLPARARTSKTCSPTWTARASKSSKSPRSSRRSSRKKTCSTWSCPPGVGEKVNDPVRMYLREMGTVPLLTREGEIEIARRIERGQNAVLQGALPLPAGDSRTARHGRGDAHGNARRARRHLRSPTRYSPTSWSRRSREEFFRVTGRSRAAVPPRSCSAARSCRPFRAASSPSSTAACCGNCARTVVQTSRLVRTLRVPEPRDPAVDRPRWWPRWSS